MCRSIKTLRRAEEPATDEEIAAAALQFVRKVSGYRVPSQRNREAFDEAVVEVALASRRLLETARRSAMTTVGPDDGRRRRPRPEGRAADAAGRCAALVDAADGAGSFPGASAGVTREVSRGTSFGGTSFRGAALRRVAATLGR